MTDDSRDFVLDFVKMVAAMRDAQKRYVAQELADNLREAVRYERLVDNMLVMLSGPALQD
jgi:hypothetical protein